GTVAQFGDAEWECWKNPLAAFPAFAGAASRLRAEALHRASMQAGRPLVVLTFPPVRSAHQSGCGLA
ncbi:MAG: hypothetical protein V3T42_06285, partial [Nitrospirales bacterium]